MEKQDGKMSGQRTRDKKEIKVEICSTYLIDNFGPIEAFDKFLWRGNRKILLLQPVLYHHRTLRHARP